MHTLSLFLSPSLPPSLPACCSPGGQNSRCRRGRGAGEAAAGGSPEGGGSGDGEAAAGGKLAGEALRPTDRANAHSLQ